MVNPNDMMKNGSSAVLIEKMKLCVAHLENGLKDPATKADVQIDDASTWCWCIVELAFRVQNIVREELSDIE